MRPQAAASAVLCLIGWLSMACQSRRMTPTSTPLPSPTRSPSATCTATDEPLPTSTATKLHTLVPSPTRGVLTDTQAVALLEDEAAARGVDLQTLSIRIVGEPRRVTIRYSSSYDADGSAFQAQCVLFALAAARVLVRVKPAIDGEIRLAVIPGGESEVGLRVTVIDGSSLENWATGSISDQEFVSQWKVWTVPLE